MSNDPQGLITFPGVTGYLTGSFTLGHGIAPSICRFQCVPQASPPPETGTLSITFGSQRIQFPDCRLLEVDNSVDNGGKQVWSLTLADCRWRWKHYRISGQYNLRLNDQNLDLASKKNSQELVKILLEAMDLKDADYSQVPKDLFPFVDWDYARADQELQKLLDSLGCRIALGRENEVRIVRLGVGRDLPQQNVVDGQASFEVTEWPDQLKFVAGPTMIQVDVPLEYVGIEPSGAVKVLKDLSYRPAGFAIAEENPFKNIDPGSMAGVEGASLEAAKKSVFRWFRPKMPLQLFGDILPKGKNNDKDQVTSLWQILPLLTTQIPHVDGDKKEKYTPDAIVWGYTDPMNLVPPLVPPAKKPLAKNVVKEKTAIVFKDFEIDQAAGIIKFEDPLITRFFDTKEGAFVNVLSELYLRVAVQIREPETRSKVHHTVTRNVTNPKGRKKTSRKSIQTIVNNEIQRAVWKDPTTGDVKDNQKEVDKYANYYFDGELRSKLVGQPATLTYAGFLNIFPDGKIFQVSWIMGADGAMTRVSRLKEDTRDVISYREMQWIQNTNRIVAEADAKKKEQPRK